jgi:Uma2 family endonuclease
MAAQPQARLTPEQYLEIERAAEFRHEYYDGRMYAMSGASYAHVLIAANLTRRIGNALEKRPCVVGTSDFRVRVSPDGLYTYPDVVVLCGEPKFADNQADTLLNPVLLIEVLSPSTEAYDRGFKFAQYRKLETLREYALVSQSEPRVEVFGRREDGHWLLSEFVGMEDVCRLESLDCRIPLADIYDKVTLRGEDYIVSLDVPPAAGT